MVAFDGEPQWFTVPAPFPDDDDVILSKEVLRFKGKKFCVHISMLRVQRTPDASCQINTSIGLFSHFLA